MDPVQKFWMYENWLADQNDDAELAKNHAYLVASFWNPEAVKQILGDGNVHESSDDEFEESSQMVKNLTLPKFNLNDNQSKEHRRRSRSLKG